MARFHLLSIHRYNKSMTACSSSLQFFCFSYIKTTPMTKKQCIAGKVVHGFSSDKVFIVFNLTNCFTCPGVIIIAYLVRQIWFQFPDISRVGAWRHVLHSQCPLSMFAKHSILCVFTSNLKLHFLVSILSSLDVICDSTAPIRLLLLYHFRQYSWIWIWSFLSFV